MTKLFNSRTLRQIRIVITLTTIASLFSVPSFGGNLDLQTAHQRLSSIRTNEIHKYQIPLTILVDKKSRWKISDIEEDIRTTEKILGECGIALAPVTYAFFEHSSTLEIGPENDYLLTQDLPKELLRPIAIYTKKIKGTYGATAYSNPEFYKDHNFEHFSVNTLFLSELRISLRKSDVDYKKMYPSTIAHELGHILLNSNHITLPGNIMDGSTVPPGDKFNSEQCAILQNHSLVSRSSKTQDSIP